MFSAVCRDALVIVEVGDSYAAPKVRAHLFSEDDEVLQDVAVSHYPEHHRALGLVPGRPCHHRVFVLAQQLLLLKNGVTCGNKHWRSNRHLTVGGIKGP